MITEEEKDKVFNCLLVGMAPSDAYIYAALKPAQIAELEEDEDWQAWIASQTRAHEYSLLKKLHEVIDQQVLDAKDSAVTWALEHLYPRYSGKPTAEGQPINISFAGVDPVGLDTVEVHQ